MKHGPALIQIAQLLAMILSLKVANSLEVILGNILRYDRITYTRRHAAATLYLVLHLDYCYF